MFERKKKDTGRSLARSMIAKESLIEKYILKYESYLTLLLSNSQVEKRIQEFQILKNVLKKCSGCKQNYLREIVDDEFHFEQQYINYHRIKL